MLGIGKACWDWGLQEAVAVAAVMAGPAGMVAVAVVRSVVAAAAASWDGNLVAEDLQDGSLEAKDLATVHLLVLAGVNP